MLYLKRSALCVQLLLLKIIDLVSWGKHFLSRCEKNDVCWCNWQCDFMQALYLWAAQWRVFLYSLLIFGKKKKKGQKIKCYFCFCLTLMAVVPSEGGCELQTAGETKASWRQLVSCYIYISGHFPKFSSLHPESQSVWNPTPIEVTSVGT